MKKINRNTFEIESTTIRELNPNEIDSVGGGATIIWTYTLTPPIASLLFSCNGQCDDEGEEDPN